MHTAIVERLQAKDISALHTRGNFCAALTPGTAAVDLAGASCVVAYGLLAWLARQPGEPPLAAFYGVVGWSALMVFGLYAWLGWRGGAISAGRLLLWALAFRLCGLVGGPFYEDDFYRYLWDAFRFATDGTPYGASPEAYFADATVPAQFQRILDQVNNPHLATIYGPLSQLAFLAGYAVAPGSVAGLQAVFIAVDTALIALLLRLAPAHNVLLYAWCPLVVKEIAFTAHPDGLGVALLVAAVAALGGKRLALAALCLGLASAAKVVALLAAPLLLLHLRWRHRALFLGVLAAAYLPFLWQGGSDLGTLAVFLEEWRFNPGVFAVLTLALPDAYARLVAAALLLAFGVWLAVRASSGQLADALLRGGASPAQPARYDWLFGAWLALSPVVNPWYLLWLLPFATLQPSRWAWTASVTVLLAYATNLQLGVLAEPYALPAWVWPVQYGPILVALAVDVARQRQRTARV